MGTALLDNRLMQDASRLVSAGGEIGSSDVIRMLHMPHTREQVAAVLQAFGPHLSREARSKLALEALVPAPAGVDHQRHDPFFDRHSMSGATYTTAAGTVVPLELQYYAGEMLHLYGECRNVRAVNDALAGSGYQAMTVRYPDGRHAALAQIWSSRFDDSTLWRYSAMFLVVVVVGEDVPPSQASWLADPNGASSALAMLDGRLDTSRKTYENRARLFLVRLVDTTQVAIDVGRERMGTDKRPGTVDLVRRGQRLDVRVADARGRGVVAGSIELTSEPSGFMPAIARAAATAGISVPEASAGTEFAYPCLARIGRAPVVNWQWRSDSGMRLQAVVPGSVSIDSSSEEGALLDAWGYAPTVAGYMPRVRGVVTGLAAPTSSRSGGRTLSETAGVPLAPLVRAVHADDIGRMASLVPVLRLIGAPGPDGGATKEPRVQSGRPRWAWDAPFLGSLSATLRKEVVGPTPDGLRINWHVKEGTFVGPDLRATVLPGAADWMRIRRDGIAVVSVQACFETSGGVRVYGVYGGLFDLGPDGYERALRDEFPELPPVVVTPTYATADPRMEWLNRTQCIGVGRVDMATPRVQFDVYAIRVGDRLRE